MSSGEARRRASGSHGLRRTDGPAAAAGEAAPVAPPPSAAARHDLLVLLVAAALFVGGTVLSRTLGKPAVVRFSHLGLSFARPARAFSTDDIPIPASPLAGLGSELARAEPEQTPPASSTPIAEGKPELPYRQVYQLPDSRLAQVEVFITPRPTYRGLSIWLKLQRQTRYGHNLWNGPTKSRDIRGAQWLRSEYEYALVPTENDAPQIAHAVEYATVQRNLLYTVTIHGLPAEITYLEPMIAATLAIGAR